MSHMSDNEIISDYRSDCTQRCCDVFNVDYSRFEGKTFYVSFLSENQCGQSDEIFQSFCEIFSQIEKKHGVCTRVKKLENSSRLKSEDFVVVFNLLGENHLKEQSHEEQEFQEGQRILIMQDCYCENPKFPVLYCPRLYGAGFSFSDQTPAENSCTNILDFFAAILFMAANYEKLEKDVYYAGHGSCDSTDAKKQPCRLEDLGYRNMISYEDGAYMLSFFKNNPDRLFCFENTYGGKLQLLHKLLFKCLCEFDRICKKHNIRYFLGGGTLLGAVRHKGMIPWDDDVDVMMLREDYEKFLSVVKDEINSEEFFFQSSETDGEYHSVFTKIRLNGTRFVTRFSDQFENMHQGIFIDIFVHDKTSNTKSGQKLHVFKTLLARSMVFNKWADKPMHFYGKFKLVCKLATAYIRKTDIKKLEKNQHRVITKYKNKRTDFLYDGTGEHLRHGAFLAKWLEETDFAEFNGRKFPVPKMYDEYLTYSYGDWKKLIPPSKRKAGHDIIYVDFGKYDL